MKRHIWTVVGLLMVLRAPYSQAQSQSSSSVLSSQTESPYPSDLWSVSLGEEPLGPGDMVYITVTGAPEFTRSYRVTQSGSIVLPLSNTQVHVAGLTPFETAGVVARSLMEAKLFVTPIVSVVALDYRSRRVSVVGAVRNPTVFEVLGPTRLLDAIAKAQGISPEAGPMLVISRNIDGGADQLQSIPIVDLLSGKDPDLNVVLRGREEIRIPEAPKLFVVGNVKSPGVFPLNEVGGTTVLKALALSQGVLPFTTKDAYIYRKTPGQVERQEILVPLRQILHRSSPDIDLIANDILYIPENAKLHMSASVLDKIANFGTSTVSGLIVF